MAYRMSLNQCYNLMRTTGTITTGMSDALVDGIATERDVWALACYGDSGYGVIHRLAKTSGVPQVKQYAQELLEPQADPFHVQVRALQEQRERRTEDR